MRFSKAEALLRTKSKNLAHDPDAAVERAQFKVTAQAMTFDQATKAVIAEIEHQARYNCLPV